MPGLFAYGPWRLVVLLHSGWCGWPNSPRRMTVLVYGNVFSFNSWDAIHALIFPFSKKDALTYDKRQNTLLLVLATRPAEQKMMLVMVADKKPGADLC
jgi:hypothetical protein